MKRKVVALASFLLATIGNVFGLAGQAHSPVFLPHNGLGAHTAFKSGLFSSLHLSGTQKQFQLITSSYAKAGYSGGIGLFTGGTIVGGTLTGTVYGPSSIMPGFRGAFRSLVVVTPPPSSGSVYQGQGQITVGTGGGAPNSLYFVNNTREVEGTIIPPYLVAGHLSAATKAFLSQEYGAFTGGYNAGVTSFNGPLLGGQLIGTRYLPGGANSGNTFLFAFGRDPLNVSGVVGSPVSVPFGNGYVTFANGLTKDIYSGQLLFATGTQTFPTSPQVSFFLPGTAGSLGIDPFNRFTTPFLTGAKNYLVFFAPLAPAHF